MNDQQQDRQVTLITPREHESNISPARETGDFLIGFFGSLIVCIALVASTTQPTPGLLSPIMITLVYILEIVATIYSFKRRRRYIGIGLTIALSLQLLIFGVFFLMLVTGIASL